MKPGEISGPLQGGPNGVVLSRAGNAAAFAGRSEAELGPREGGAAANRSARRWKGFTSQSLRDRLEKEGKIKINKAEMERLSSPSEGT